MPEFWQFPTVSMGLGPICSLYQARFNRYLKARGLISWRRAESLGFVGDGESDEPESLGAITLGAREGLDNLIWVINCNLQRLDGPVRGNGKIIQELEGLFRGAGWNVIKVIWGSEWDEIIARDKSGLLLKRMEECVDGEYQKYCVEPGSYTRYHFFGKYPELLELVNHLSDEQIHKLLRGGHDTLKVYAAYKAAMAHKGQPTVILAKTVKGYGLGEAGEGRNITHKQKKMNEKELREFRGAFRHSDFRRCDCRNAVLSSAGGQRGDQIFVGTAQETRWFCPDENSNRSCSTCRSWITSPNFSNHRNSEISTTTAFGKVLRVLLKHNGICKNIVPIIPDEARTFGLDAFFRQIGIYSHKGQLYEPVDKESLLYYHEAKDGQILEEGISEAGSMASFIAAGTSYATHGVPTIPFYIYYSMFGCSASATSSGSPATSRRKDFCSVPPPDARRSTAKDYNIRTATVCCTRARFATCLPYDPAFAFELAVIIADGLRRMYR